jgi:hypothetical protein
MIYLLITTSINNNYIQLYKLIEIYADVLNTKKNETITQNNHLFFTNRNRRHNPAMQMRIGNVHNIITSIEPKPKTLTPQSIDRKRIKELNENDRALEYKESITTCLSYLSHKIKPIIIENNGKRNTFLDEFGIDVHYTENNKLSFKHKGINELMDIKSAISAYDIKNDDIVIKLTGRYKLMDDSFLKTVIEHLESHDAFIKFFNVFTEEFMENDCVLGLFAIRCKYLKDFNYDPELEIPETQFAEYVRKSECRIYEMERLGLSCKFSDTYKKLEV